MGYFIIICFIHNLFRTFYINIPSRSMTLQLPNVIIPNNPTEELKILSIANSTDTIFIPHCDCCMIATSFRCVLRNNATAFPANKPLIRRKKGLKGEGAHKVLASIQSRGFPIEWMGIISAILSALSLSLSIISLA